MARESFATVVRRRASGLLFIVVVLGLLLLSVAIYQKRFTPVVLVKLKTDHTGNELVKQSDVKERGIIVGSVRNVQASGDGATVTLALDPDRISIIPKNVSAQILPKTLFGEQYVSLSIPTDPAAHIKAGDVIPQDRSQGALETEQVLGDTLPLLNALEPAELNTTLTAMAQALSGRGKALGQTLVELDQYLRAMNRTSPTGKTYTAQLIADLTSLGQVATLYNDSAPNIVATLQNLQVSNNTIISRQAALSQLLDVADSTSDVLGNFLQANEQSLITVSGTTDRVYGLLKEYSPEFGCIFSAMSQLEVKTSNAIRNGSIQLSITVDQQPSDLGAYKPGDQPKLITGYGPNCFGLPDNVSSKDSKGNFEVPPQFQCLNDGAPLTTAACSQDAKSDAGYGLQSEGSAPETAMINSLIASTYGTTPANVPPVATILAAPALRGSAVSVK